MRTALDITNWRFGKLVAISPTGKRVTGGKIWSCLCDCGNTVEATLGNLRTGQTKSCGCIVRKHSKTNDKVYHTWQNIKDRCLNENNQRYNMYGGIGITLQENFIDDFLAFYKEVGDPPDKSSKWSLDRIDNNKGYVAGNMRWATLYQQARNKSMARNNNTGKTGVGWEVNNRTGTTIAWCSWREDINGEMKPMKRGFSTRKYGLLEAFAMACVVRDSAIARLNQQGYGYSENHGKEKDVNND